MSILAALIAGMAALRIQASIAVTGTAYTAAATVGAAAVPVQLVLDTGSSVLAVDGGFYDPVADAATTTRYLQVVPYGSAFFVGAVVQTSVAFAGAANAANLTLPAANLAVTYDSRRHTFGDAQGILGLAYKVLDSATLMPTDTWQTQYTADQISLGKEADLDPYLDQLSAQGLCSTICAFALQRSTPSLADAALNQGIFVLGGGHDCTDLYDGAFTQTAIVHEQFYNVALLSVQVGAQPAIPAPAIAPGQQAASNAIMDSGTNTLILTQPLYLALLAAFNIARAGFGDLLQAHGYDRGGGCDQTKLDLTQWPPVIFVFQGLDGTPVRIELPPAEYWQFDTGTPGQATAMICGDRGSGGGQSILGLPLFTNRFVVFDRSATDGRGFVGFAAAKSTQLVS
jgi:hypothetical protein